MASISKNQPKLHIESNPTDRLIETIGLLIVLGMIIITAIYFPQLPDQIPIHFNAAGEPDGFGSKAMIWFLPVLGLVMYLGLRKLSTVPHIFNYPVKITQENAEQKYKSATRLIRVMNLIVTALFCYIVWASIRVALNQQAGLGNSFLLIMCGVIGITVLYFSVRMAKD